MRKELGKKIFEVEFWDDFPPETMIGKNEGEVLRFYHNFHEHLGKKVRNITLIGKQSD